MLENDCFQGTAGLRSRRFLFRKFFQRDKADAIILDVDVLSALTAGFVGCFHIDRLYQLSQHTWIDFLDIHVFVCRSDEPFNIFVETVLNNV